jgi:hydroxymethylbilane synthase
VRACIAEIPIRMASAPALPRLLIALRKSPLSMWQGQYVRDRLQALHPSCEIVLHGMTTQGDLIVDRALADIGGKGLFIEAIEDTLTEGSAHLAVHSLKDMPMEVSEGFSIAAVPVREDARDTLVSDRYRSIESMPAGSIVGTSSLRREAQVRKRNPGVSVDVLRGNVATRISRMREGRYDAIVLAAAGLHRLGLADRIAAYLEPDAFVPAVGQGALALECRSDRPDVIAMIAPLTDRPTLHAVTAERAFSRKLAGSCKTPIAGHATFRGNELRLVGLIATRDGRDMLRGELVAQIDPLDTDTHAADALGRELGDDFIARGAARFQDI